jgi:hypothetical protein
MLLEKATQGRFQLAVRRGRPLAVVARWALHIISAFDAHIVLTYVVVPENATNGERSHAGPKPPDRNKDVLPALADATG